MFLRADKDRCEWDFPLTFLLRKKSVHCTKGDNIIKQEHQINSEIRDKEVRLIGADGEQLGIVSAAEANRIADEQNLDLVKISPNTNPPVCKIMNYGKFLFDKAKREREQRKNQKIVETKEVQLSMTIEMHDMETKAKNATKFLTAGNKVKVVLRMKGRQQAYSAKGIEIVNTFCGLVEEFGSKDNEPKVEGRNIITTLIPKTNKKAK